MAIKDDIDSIKEELNTQEQFLENIIKSERFLKKYKKVTNFPQNIEKRFDIILGKEK